MIAGRGMITGGSGQLGRALALTAPTTGLLFSAPDRHDFNLSRPTVLTAKLDILRPDWIVNAGAYTDVDGAESDVETAHAVNAEAPAAMAEWACRNGVSFIQISTDFVFDGEASAARNPNAAVNPLNVYGRTKLDGERAVTHAHPDALILRTSYLYGPDYGAGFIDRMLAHAVTSERLSVVTDQVGSPTSATALASAIWHILETGARPGGLHHAVCHGAVSRYDFVRTALDFARAESIPLRCKTLNRAASADFPTAARRPSHSALDATSFERACGVTMPDWRTALRGHIRTIAPAVTASVPQI